MARYQNREYLSRTPTDVVVSMYYDLKLSQSAIARSLGVSQPRICHVLTKWRAEKARNVQQQRRTPKGNRGRDAR